ncbi:septation ring formation regulator EzrA [Alteribacillus bidgolensis]|uniref:Septation ring formation regulator n=1 Tax=Alteribacillus bidgolensis TaxID=930129 RepID=A0A1G8EUC3_9BACI|nr:septation ring formation regulator EzrA [Alteribacillus bidgolensis]SDH73506.1 septation ring formation regulator [Alteribacillus bidgolensis]
MMVYVILTAALIIAVIIIYGAVSRKKIYKEVDRLEQWKTKIANQPVADEIAKVKGLTMSGETEEKFEEWRKEWDDIIGSHLPDIEEALFDIEEWANKYRFRKSKELLDAARVQLKNIDSHILNIFYEVENLIHSEEENRTGITEIKERFSSIQQYISQNWLSLGSTARIFENHMNELKDMVAVFDQETEAGNYMKANHILNDLNEKLRKMEQQVNAVPALLVEVEAELPEECKEVQYGMEEMESKGYQLDHFDFHSILEEFRNEFPVLSKAVADLELERVQDRVQDIRHYFDYIYQTLEKEVEARRFVEVQAIEAREEIDRLEIQLNELQQEREKVKMSYRIPDEEDKRQKKAENGMEGTLKNWRVFKDMYEYRKISFTGLKENLESLKQDIYTLDKDIRSSKEQLYTLRKDELKALETLKTLRRQLLQDRIKLERSLLPKIPSILLNEVDAAEERLEAAVSALEEVPVEMGRVNAAAEDAEHLVNKVHQELRTTLEQARLAERAIQYGNKYRSQSLSIDEKLLQAEVHFRKGYYDEAVHTAIGAVEQKEPNALENISGRY